MSIAGKHIVISGGGSGLGAEIARQSAAAGANVTILGRRQDALDQVATAIGGLGLSCDVTDRAAMDAALEQAREKHGPIAIAIANAGAVASKPFSAMSVEDLNWTLDVNLIGVFNLWQACLADMKAENWGRLIAIASTASLKGYGYVSAYCAAKHGVLGMTRALAQELGQDTITANAICPGFLETPMLERSISNIMEKTGATREKAIRQLQAGNPQRRFIQVDEVAGTALWLCSDAARSVNGHALSISGGEV